MSIYILACLLSLTLYHYLIHYASKLLVIGHPLFYSVNSAKDRNMSFHILSTVSILILNIPTSHFTHGVQVQKYVSTQMSNVYIN